MGLTNRKKRKYIGLLLSGVVFLSGCGEKADKAEEKGAEEPVALSWYINYSWFNTDFGENIVSQKIPGWTSGLSHPPAMNQNC